LFLGGRYFLTAEDWILARLEMSGLL
jgi:hypothetical protein